MKPASFDYFVPASVEEALDVLAKAPPGVKILAGGQSLVPAMNFRLATPSAIVDLNNIPSLAYIKPMADGGLAIGAMTRDSAVEHDPEVMKRFPIITECLPHIAHAQIRNRGTIGGIIAHADPTAQLPGVLVALGTKVKIVNKTGEKWYTVEDFIIGPFMSILLPTDILVEVIVPPLPPRCGCSYKQMARQHGAAALVGVAAVVTLDEKGICKSARLVYISVGGVPTFGIEAAKVLVGQQPTAEIIEAASEKAASLDVDPGDDIHASIEYRRYLTKTLTRQSLTAAFEQAGKKGG